MKTRLTITLDDALLHRIDEIIDKKTIRNRSHAIEHLLEKSFRPTVSTAVILAGGPKKEPFGPMYELDGKPLISYTIDLFRRHGVNTIIIATNEQGKQLQELLGDGASLGVKLYFVFEKQTLGTAGALRNVTEALPLLLNSDQPFFVIAGDILTTIDLGELAQFHSQNQALVTVAVKPRATKQSYDTVLMQGNTVVNFEKSSILQNVNLINTGVYVFEKTALNLIPKTSPAMLEKDVFPQLAKTKKILAFPFQGVWSDVGSDSDAQEMFAQMS